MRVGTSVPIDEPAVVAGEPEAVAERFVRLASLGFSGFNSMLGSSDADGQAERIAGEVVPELRRTLA